MPQIIEANDVNGRAVGQYGIHAPPPRLTEIERLLDKEVDLRARMARTPERKDSQFLFLDPSASLLLPGEVAQRYWGACFVVEAFESSDRCQRVRFAEVEHEVEVCRKPRMAMKHDGHAADDEVPNIGPVEGTKNLRECAV